MTQARVEGDITWCIGKDTTGAFSTVVDNFNKANPDANAELLELPTAADEQRRLQVQRLRAESPECDVLGMDVIWTAEYAAQGWLMQAKPRPVSPVYPQISEAIYNNVFAALQGDMSPDEAASTMNDDIQEALEIF